MIAVFSAMLYLLVLTRLWDAAASHRRALNRERVLRQAGLSLVTAADVTAVAAAVKDAVRRPARASTRRATRCSACGLTARSAPAAPGAAQPPQADQLGRLAETWLPAGDRDDADSHRRSRQLPEPARTACPPPSGCCSAR